MWKRNHSPTRNGQKMEDEHDPIYLIVLKLKVSDIFRKLEWDRDEGKVLPVCMYAVCWLYVLGTPYCIYGGEAEREEVTPYLLGAWRPRINHAPRVVLVFFFSLSIRIYADSFLDKTNSTSFSGSLTCHIPDSELNKEKEKVKKIRRDTAPTPLPRPCIVAFQGAQGGLWYTS